MSAGFVGFLIATTLVAGAVCGLAVLAYPGAAASCVTGCSISLIASWLGVIPLRLGKVTDPASKMKLSFAATAMRLLVVVLLGVAAVLTERFEATPLLLSLAGSYLLLVAVDTTYALRFFRHQE